MRVVLVGGGGHASDVLGGFEDAARATNVAHPVVGYVDDWNEGSHRFRGRGIDYLGTIDDLPSLDVTHFIGATGYPGSRRLLVEKCVALAPHLTAVTLVHPAASLGTGVEVGEGSLVLGAARASPLVRIGRHAYIAYGCLVGHDCQVEDFVSVLPGAVISGSTRLGEGCTIGTNATIIEGVAIGAGATVGAGAVVVRDVEPGVTVKGVPARP